MTWFVNLKISQKLIIVSLLVVFALGGLGAYLILQMGRVYDAANYGNVNSVPSLDKMYLITGGSKDYYISILRHIANSDLSRMSMLEGLISDARAQTENALTEYEKLLSDDKDRQMLTTDRELFQELVRAIQDILPLSRANKNEEARLMLRERGLPVYQKLDKALDEHTQYNMQLADTASENAATNYSSARTMGILVIGILSVVWFMLMLFIEIGRASCRERVS
jgi:methyl-accepting chemotaxis protein